MFLTYKTKLDGTPSKIKWKIYTCLLAHCILSFKVFLIEECKIKLVCQFLYFLLFYIASEFTSADIIFNIYWKKKFVKNFHFLTDSPNPTSLLLSVKISGFIFGLWFYDLISQHKWLYVTSYLCPWIKYLTAKTIKYILKCWERSVYM